MLFPLAVGAAALVTAGYHTMSPRSQLYGRTFLGLGRGARHLALTFDDGPNDPHTRALLEVLARHQVRATFFMIGRYVAQRPDIARAVAEAGHVVANHTYHHPLLIFCSQRQVRLEIEECQRALQDAVGEHSRLFRPPFGGRSPGVLHAIRGAGYQPVMWSVSGWDWKAESAAEIEAAVHRQVRGGDVILLHDGGHKAMSTDRSHTVRATEAIIGQYKDEGYEFVTVPEMIAAAAGSG
jgi:peptidoglycan/xylan/chitin deacetylase (PgdA/CDA1 family)